MCYFRSSNHSNAISFAMCVRAESLLHCPEGCGCAQCFVFGGWYSQNTNLERMQAVIISYPLQACHEMQCKKAFYTHIDQHLYVVLCEYVTLTVVPVIQNTNLERMHAAIISYPQHIMSCNTQNHFTFMSTSITPWFCVITCDTGGSTSNRHT